MAALICLVGVLPHDLWFYQFLPLVWAATIAMLLRAIRTSYPAVALAAVCVFLAEPAYVTNVNRAHYRITRHPAATIESTMMSDSGAPRISLIVPIYNEEATINELRARLLPVLEPLGAFEVILINDGSRDRSPEMLDALCASDPRFVVLHFSRNFGHRAAVTAGLHESTGECAVIIDADLQDPPALIAQMVKKWEEGFDVVYAQRRAGAKAE